MRKTSSLSKFLHISVNILSSVFKLFSKIKKASVCIILKFCMSYPAQYSFFFLLNCKCSHVGYLSTGGMFTPRSFSPCCLCSPLIYRPFYLWNNKSVFKYTALRLSKANYLSSILFKKKKLIYLDLKVI